MADCSTCDGTGVAPRCDSEQGQWRCQRYLGHDGPHMAYLEGDTALRWGMVGRGCFDPSCIRKAGHPLPHRDGKGMSWVPDDEETPWDSVTMGTTG